MDRNKTIGQVPTIILIIFMEYFRCVFEINICLALQGNRWEKQLFAIICFEVDLYSLGYPFFGGKNRPLCRGVLKTLR
jgi:hypothetical protein